ncbi:integrase arm-type DNA-binding domain-containing protein [Novosphingobium sp. SL115]|uniref:tyrosine-type recombinase/integrase n=1 Tax=Novosphingobium sp. SL115 TaxID=2995150 RepID=UPI0022723E58|nr:integrase arm-type DNA-binding domain-containing protein [Novosphingobium sp. SL115]MCY1672148.1 integrase arm-type DNA-binding domain-containing protein [Novosphingobium sp. SL115]
MIHGMRFGIYGMSVLSDAKVRSAKATGKAYKLSDGQQLYLHVSSAGGRSWRMNYQFGRNDQGKPVQKTLTIGSYPAISLKEAREARDQAKGLLARGVEPKPQDLFERAPPPVDMRPRFGAVARDWHTLQKTRWSKVHAADVLASLEADVFPALGAMAMADVTAPDVFKILRVVVDRGAIETAHRLRQRVSAVFTYGIALGIVSVDPAQNLAIAIPSKPKAKAQPAIIHLPKLRQLLVDCEAERCRAPTKLALRLIALTAVRPNEIHGARWDEFEDLDGEAPLWRIPAGRMKGDIERKADEDGDHLVPLSPEAVAVIKAVAMVNGDLPLVFPSERHVRKPMSENTLRALLIRAGYYQRHVPHGFRAAFSTIMNERCERMWRARGHNGPSPDRAIIDLMLAHAPSNKVEGAYNRAAYMERRRELACDWAVILTRDMWPPEIHVGQPIRWAATGMGRPSF